MSADEYFSPNLSPGGAARYVGVSESWLNKLRVVGGGPEYVKLGRRVIYPIVDLDRWMTSNKTRSTAMSAVAAGRANE